jgi:hypothetical protein
LRLANPTKFAYRFGWNNAIGARGYGKNTWNAFAEATADRFVFMNGDKFGLSLSQVNIRKDFYLRNRNISLDLKRNSRWQ